MRHLFVLTLREVVRKRFLFVSLLLSGLFLVLYAVGLHYAVIEFREGANPPQLTLRLFVIQLASLAIYMSTFISAFFAVFSASHTTAGELEGGELLAVVSRPLTRDQIVLGKCAGVATASVAFSLALVGLILLITTAVSGETFRNVPLVFGLYCLQPLVLLSVTLFFGMFLKTIAAGVTGMLLYMLGVIGGSTEQITAAFNPGSQAADIAGLAHYLIPTDALYRLIYSALATDIAIPFAGAGPFGASRVPEWWMVGYAAGYALLFLAAAIALFRRKDL
jgi:ABC-type transport system involved in multi-copper enzyme maturation permease subunit